MVEASSWRRRRSRLASSAAILRAALVGAALLAATACSDESDGAPGGAGGTGAAGGAGGGAGAGGASPDPTAFRPTDSLAQARTGHTATRLTDGRVLLVGGERVASRTPIDAVDLFDPVTELWTAGPALPEPRANHVAVLLDDGRVLVAGGGMSAPIGVPKGEGVLASALLFDPESGTWSPTGALLEGRSHFEAARLPSGRVLVAGGGAGTHDHGSTCTGAPDCGPVGDTLASAEIYDPATGAFEPTAAMSEARDCFTLTALEDGRVLAAAGANDYAESFASTEIYDEQSGAWSAGPDLAAEDRLFHAAAVLPSGQVLVGGGKQSNVAMLASVVRVDVGASSSAPTGALSVSRTASPFVALTSGRVLSVGGFHCPLPCQPVAVAEIYEQSAGQWTGIAPLLTPRAGHTATLLGDGRVLVAGGYGATTDEPTCELSE